MSFERTLQTHGTFQWPFVYCLIGLYWSHNSRFELRQSKFWSQIAIIIKSRNFMSDAWFSMGWAAQVFWESVSSESPHRVDLLLTWGTAFSALPDLFTCFHQLTSFCQILSDFGVCVPSFFLLRFGNMQEISDIKATWRNRSYNNCKCLLPLTTPNAMRYVWKFSPRYEIWLYKSMETLPSWRRAFFPTKAHGEDPGQWDGNRLSKAKRAKGHDNAT